MLESKKMKCKALQFAHYSFRAEFQKLTNLAEAYEQVLDSMIAFTKTKEGLHLNVVPFPKENCVVCSFILKKTCPNWEEEISSKLQNLKIIPLLKIN